MSTKRTERERQAAVTVEDKVAKLHLFDTIQQSPLPLLGQPWVQESPADIEEVYHVAMCVWMWPRACACVCEYLLAPTMPCISLVIPLVNGKLVSCFASEGLRLCAMVP